MTPTSSPAPAPARPAPASAAADLPQATPAEIDTALAEIWSRYYAIADKVAAQSGYREDYEQRLAAVDAGTYRYRYTDADRDRDERGLAKVTATIEALEADGWRVLAEADPYEAEYQRRGGWTRAYLVTNANGHIHRSRSCATCFPTTRFVWLTAVSGHREEEIVDLAGSSACTTCYPSAPAESRAKPCRLEDPAAVAARTERAQAKAARDAEKAAKAIANPDGTELRLPTYGTIRTERTAEITYVDIGTWRRHLLEQQRGEHLVPELDASMAALLAALAHKRGTSPEEQQKALAVKIEKKFKRDYG